MIEKFIPLEEKLFFAEDPKRSTLKFHSILIATDLNKISLKKLKKNSETEERKIKIKAKNKKNNIN